MVTMNHCVATAACDEPEVDGERGYPGYEKRERKAPPEERALQPRVHCARNRKHDRVIHWAIRCVMMTYFPESSSSNSVRVGLTWNRAI